MTTEQSFCLRVFQPGSMGVGVRIASMAAALPTRKVTNADLVALGAPLTAEEMEKLTGVVSRRWAQEGQATSDLAAAAARHAMERAGVTSAQLHRLVLATVSPDHPSPATACRVQKLLGAAPCPAYDITATCAGFVFALDQATRAVATGDGAVLAVAAETRSRWLDIQDRGTCALFGDGAAAAVVQPGAVGTGILAVGTGCDGEGFHSVYVPAGGSREPATAQSVEARRHFIRMADGPAVYMQAVEGMLQTAEGLLAALGMGFDDVDLVIPHQPNRRLLERLARLARLDAGKLFVNMENLGNMSAASVAVALTQALEEKRVSAGSRVLLVAAGAGYTAGAVLLQLDQALLSACQGPGTVA